MKVGILTFHFAHNYGAILQVYALQKTLEKSIAADVEIIDYRPDKIESQYKNKLIIDRNSSMKSIIKKILIYIINYKSKNRKAEKFFLFTKDYLNLSKKEYTKDCFYKSDYNAFVFGSDQIWNPHITKGFDEIYFGGFSTIDNNARRISYAASIGVSRLSNSYLIQLKDLIGSLDFISVREKQGKKIIKDLTEKNVEVVLDPTFLLSRKEWDEIAVPPQSKENYLLIYKLEYNIEMMRAAREIAEEKGLKIIEISGIKGKKRSTKSHKIITDIGPREMLGLFKEATFILTNSFHGTAFSIIYKKNFFTYPHSKVPSRMESLLKSLKLDDRLIEPNNKILQVREVDYSIAEEILEKNKIQSIEFLRNALLS